MLTAEETIEVPSPKSHSYVVSTAQSTPYAGMDVFVNVTQEPTQAIGGFVKLGVGGFKIIIGEIVELVVPHEFEILNCAVIPELGHVVDV